MNIEIKEGGPLHELLIAVNCYVSTGDYVGHGAVLEPSPHAGFGRGWLVLVPFRPANPTDAADFRAFRARTDQIAAQGGPAVAWHDLGPADDMHTFAFVVAKHQVEALRAALLAEPGPLGWGSERQKIHDIGLVGL